MGAHLLVGGSPFRCPFWISVAELGPYLLEHLPLFKGVNLISDRREDIFDMKLPLVEVLKVELTQRYDLFGNPFYSSIRFYYHVANWFQLFVHFEFTKDLRSKQHRWDIFQLDPEWSQVPILMDSNIEQRLSLLHELQVSGDVLMQKLVME